MAKSTKVDTPRAGSWAATVNDPVPEPPLHEIHPTFRNAEITRRFKNECAGWQYLTPERLAQAQADFRKHLRVPPPLSECQC